MNISACSRYQKRALLWQRLSIPSAILFGMLLMVAGDGPWLFIGIIGFVFSLVALLTSWLFKKYYRALSLALIEYEKQPSLAKWTIAAERWADYQHIEQEHRKRGYIKYLIWSPALIVFLAIMIWTEIDELPFDINLLWWGIPIYVVMMILLYVQMRVALNKTKVVGDHHIELKRVGASIDGNITLWGKITADTHQTLGKSIEALLFAKSDAERKVNNTYVHEEGGLLYVVINYNADENNQLDLFLPLPNEMRDIVSGQLSSVQADSVFVQPQVIASGDGYQTKKYLTWMIGAISVISALYWVFDQGLPLYHQWRAEQIFDEALALEGKGARAEALQKYKESVQEYDQLPGAYVNIGTLFMNDGLFDSALYYYDLALIVDPDYSLAHFNKGVVYYTQQDYRPMVDEFYLYEKLAPDSHDQDLMMGDAFYSLQLIDSSYMYYQRAVEHGKKSAALSYMIARIKADQQQWSDAQIYLEESLQQDSVSADSYLLLSEVQRQLGNIQQADENYSKGLELQRVAANN